MHTRTTAGQATIEYVAAIALIAAIFVFAGPAVGAPAIGKQVVHGIRLGICLVAGDVCSDGDAKAAGLAPCPLQSDVKGHDVTGTAFSIELGGRETLTVTPRSDGTVGVVRSLSSTSGFAGGVGAGLDWGPVTAEVGAGGTIHQRVQIARGWEFPNQAAADRFLAHAVRNTVNGHDFPPAWHSLEAGEELSASVGTAIGAKGAKERADLVGLSASASAALGGRLTRDGAVTLYGRVTADYLDATWPMLPTTGHGSNQWIVEYTFNHDGPRELAFRQAAPSKLGNELTETVGRLDLRAPGNLAVAQSLVDAALPWPRDVVAHVGDVLRRIQTNGTVERTTSAVDDNSWGASAHASDEVKFGLAYKRIKVRKTLVDATARTGGPERDRFDCTGAQS